MSTWRWLSPREAAALVGLKPRTLQKLATAGALPHRRINARTFRYRDDELSAWLDARPGRRLEEVR